MGFQERIKNSAILSLGIIFVLLVFAFMAGGEINPVMVVMTYIQIVVGGAILFTITDVLFPPKKLATQP